MREKKRFPLRAALLLLYALVLLGLIAWGAQLLKSFLTAYEQAGPKTALEEYLSALDDEKAFALAEESLRSFDGNLAPPEEIFARRVKPYLDAGLDARRVAEECGESREVYRLFSGLQPVGRLAIEPCGEGKFGVALWGVTEEELDFSFLGGDGPLSVTAPEDFTVLCNGYALDERYVTGRREYRGELDYLREEGFSLPALVEYTVPDSPLTTELRILDADGVEYSPGADFDSLITRRLLESCTPEERAALEDFARRYAEAYVAFMGGTGGTYVAGYQKLRPLLDEGSDLALRSASARRGMSWTQNRRNELAGVENRAAIALGDGKYVCDFAFSVKARTAAGDVTVENRVRLFVVEREGSLYAYTMLLY